MRRWVWIGILLVCSASCSRQQGDAVGTEPTDKGSTDAAETVAPSETAATSAADAASSAAAQGPHAGYLAARNHLERARTAEAKRDLARASKEAQRGLERLGTEYAPEGVIDDTGQKLALAESLEQEGKHAEAVATRIRMLEVRLGLYAKRYPDAPQEGRALRLVLAVSPTTSQVGDDVEATVELANAGTEPVAVNARMALNNVHAPAPYRELTFEIEGPSGKKLPFQAKVRIGAAQPSDVRTLAPGEKLKRVEKLSQFYNLDTPGTYAVRAHYASAPVANAAGQPAWTELVSSDTVKLERKPEGPGARTQVGPSGAKP